MSFIYDIFAYLMKGCLYISGNHYILALFFFALVMEIVLLPLAIKQQKSQIKMAQIKPLEMAIREKYKGRNDRATQQKMTLEIQEMYQQNGHSQFSGCLPLLIQLPIILILFTIVREPITYSSSLDGFNVQSEAKIAVEFYEAEKNALIKDAFEGTEYDEEYKKLIGYQQELGLAKVEEDTPSDVFKFSYNDTEYYPTGVGAYPEMALQRLMIDGDEKINELAEAGKIDKSFLEKTASNGKTYGEILAYFNSCEDKLPNYKIAGQNLINEPDFKENIWLMLIPLLVFLTSFLQTKLTRKFGAAANQTDANGNPIGGGLFLEVGMPIISALFAYNFAAAIGAYWIWRTLIGMLKTFILAKAMPIPVVTEEQIAEAKKAMKAKQKKKKVITIEVDEDDNSYDDMIVHNSGNSNKKAVDPTQRTPRRIEMLTADDEDEAVSTPEEVTEEADNTEEN